MADMTMAESRPGAAPFWRGDAAKAMAAMLVILAMSAFGGFKGLAGTADNDSLLRLVEVRDLLGGQGWFDLHQYRMGIEGSPLLMHWSRIVDAPIAAIILAVTGVTGSQAMGETVALIAWPLMLYAAALYFLIRVARLAMGDAAVFPATVIGATTLYYIGIFPPGAIDHHNLQLVLMLAMVFFLLRAGPGNRGAFAAGVAAVLMLAVGMETVPYVAVGGLFVAIWFLLKGGEARGVAAGFGLAFALTSAIVFFGTVGRSDWGAAYCDAYSVVQFAIGALAGLGLALVASLGATNETLPRRAAGLVLLGVVVAAVALVYFPQCLSDPYADLAPMLQSYWLEEVGEAQPLWSILADAPEKAAGHFATVLVALAVMAFHIRRNGLRREDALIGAMLVVALLVSIWQVRGSRFSLPLACVPLSFWIAGCRAQAQSALNTMNSLKLVGAWIASFHVAWILAAIGVWSVFATAEAKEKLVAKTCYARTDYADLAAMPPERVMVISNLGAATLRYTGHSVLAGPYHRNVAGNLAALEAFIGTPDKAKEIALANDTGLVAFCRGNNETNLLAKRAPDGLLAGLLAGNVPAWMQIIPETEGKPLELYRVAP